MRPEKKTGIMIDVLYCSMSKNRKEITKVVPKGAINGRKFRFFLGEVISAKKAPMPNSQNLPIAEK
jgi:hypothetical protein